jgi:hypothetical protein
MYPGNCDCGTETGSTPRQYVTTGKWYSEANSTDSQTLREGKTKLQPECNYSYAHFVSHTEVNLSHMI